MYISCVEDGEIQAVQCVQVDHWSSQDDQTTGTCPQTRTHHGGGGDAGKIDLNYKLKQDEAKSACVESINKGK